MTFPILIANKVFLQPCIKLGMPKVFFFVICDAVYPATVLLQEA